MPVVRKLSSVLAYCLLSFLVHAQPAISSFSPAGGNIGSAVTINGTGFDPQPGNNLVFFGATKATVQSASANSLSVTVPAGASYTPLSVTVNGLTAYTRLPFVITFPGGKPIYQNPDQSQNSFEQEIYVPTDLHPQVVVTADFDGDGKPDLATANNYSITGQPASVSILRNTSHSGSVSFAPHMDLPNGVLTYTLATGDLDGDGKPDLVATSIVDRSISVFRNTSSPGNIGFAPKTDFAHIGGAYGITIADLDVDGKPDIVITNYFDAALTIWRNTSSVGNISFAASVSLPVALTPRGVASSDIDGDGKPDLVVSNEFSNSVSIFRNISTKGSFSFAPRIDYPCGNSPYGLAAGDLDADGRPDIVVANNGSNSFSVFRNTSSTGTIGLAARLDFGGAVSPFSISLSDLNGDGIPDICVPSGNLYVCQNNSSPGNISLAAATVLNPVFTQFTAALVDLDGDGKNDIAGGGLSNDKVTVFRNKNNEPTISAFSPADAIAGDTITITGYNFDGTTVVAFDTVPAASYTIVNSNTIRAVVGNGASGSVAVSNVYGTNHLSGFTFHAPPKIVSFTPNYGKTGDSIVLNGNYLLDVTEVWFGGIQASSFVVQSGKKIIAVVGQGATGYVKLVSSYGRDSLNGFTYYPPPLITSFTPSGGGAGTAIQVTGQNFTGASLVKIGDADVQSFTVLSSTQLSIVVGEGSTGRIEITTPGGKAISDSIFVYPPPVISGISPMSGPAGTVVTISGTNFRGNPGFNQVYFGAAKATIVSAGTGQLKVLVPPGATYDPVSVTVNRYSVYSPGPFISTFQPAGAGITDSSFLWAGGFSTNGDPRNVYMYDLDGDGKTDLIAANYFSGSVSILKNTSFQNRISFDPSITLAGGFGQNIFLPLAIGDVTGDGKPDIVIGNWGMVVMVYRNTSQPGQISFAPRINYPATEICRGIVIRDMDGDGRPDLILASGDYGGITKAVSVYRNIGRDSLVNFAPRMDFNLSGFPLSVRVADFDGDGNPDVAVNDPVLSVLRNTSTPGNLSFEPPLDFSGNASNQPFNLADFDGDGLPDAIMPGYGVFTILRNTSTAGSVSFAPRQDISNGEIAEDITTGQLDGDGKADLIIVNDGKSLLLYRNLSAPGNIILGNQVPYTSQLDYNWVYGAAIGDLDGDGKPDIAAANGADNKIAIFRNRQGEQNLVSCSNSSLAMGTGIVSSLYQWQVNEGNGFINIPEGGIYSGTHSDTLRIQNASTAIHLNQYRCITDTGNSRITNLFIYPVVIPGGTTHATGEVCTNSLVDIWFTGNANTPINTTVELWENSGSGYVQPVASQSYQGYDPHFSRQYPTGGTVHYYFRLIPPATPACSYIGYSDTISTLINQVSIPVISAVNAKISINNPDASAAYSWQVLNQGNWVDISPVATGNTYTGTSGNTYRVRGTKGSCLVYSNSLLINVTAIEPVTAASAGIRFYPNPAHTWFFIDSLKLADQWQTLEILNSSGQLVNRNYSLRNKTSILIYTEDLNAGLYLAILHRKKGAPVLIRIVKQ